MEDFKEFPVVVEHEAIAMGSKPRAEFRTRNVARAGMASQKSCQEQAKEYTSGN